MARKETQKLRVTVNELRKEINGLETHGGIIDDHHRTNHIKRSKRTNRNTATCQIPPAMVLTYIHRKT